MTPASVQAFVAEQHAPDATLYVLLDLLADCAADDPLRIEVLRQTLGDDAVTPVHRLMLHPHLHQHTGFRAVIEQAVQGQAPLSQLLVPYNDIALQRAVSDLTYAGAPQ